MIRKIFASLVIIFFTCLITPTIIISSVSSTFLNESRLLNKILPEAYEPATALMAEQFAKTPEETAIFKNRITQILPRESYAQLASVTVESIKKQLEALENTSSQQITLDFSELKTKLKEIIISRAAYIPTCDKAEEPVTYFRFCKPSNIPPELDLGRSAATVLEKEIPPNIKLENEHFKKIKPAFIAITLIKKYITVAAIILYFLMLGLVALFIFSPLRRVMRWVAVTSFIAAIPLLLFLFALIKIPALIKMQNGLSDVQFELIKVITSTPVHLLMTWGLVFVFTAISVFTVSFFIKKRKK